MTRNVVSRVVSLRRSSGEKGSLYTHFILPRSLQHLGGQKQRYSASFFDVQLRPCLTSSSPTWPLVQEASGAGKKKPGSDDGIASKMNVYMQAVIPPKARVIKVQLERRFFSLFFFLWGEEKKKRGGGGGAGGGRGGLSDEKFL